MPGWHQRLAFHAKDDACYADDLIQVMGHWPVDISAKSNLALLACRRFYRAIRRRLGKE